jgi:hypothetical protein
MARTQAAGPLIWRVGVIALVLIAQAAISALAFASPADPSWISGIYDDADYDDLVALAAAGTGNTAPVVPTVLRPRPLLAGRLLDGGEPAAPVRPGSALRIRPPPAA